MTARATREILAITQGGLVEGAIIEIPSPDRESISAVLDNEYSRPVRLLDLGDGTFAIRRATLGLGRPLTRR